MKTSGLAAFPFVTPFGLIGLPWWIPALILGREAVHVRLPPDRRAAAAW